MPLTFHKIQFMSLNPQQRNDATYLKFTPLLNNMPFYHNHKIIIKLPLFSFVHCCVCMYIHTYMKVTSYMNLLELPVEFTGVAGDNCLADFESDKTVRSELQRLP